MTFDVVLYLGLGRLFIYLFQKAPYKDYLSGRWGFLKALFECDLCLGWWVYFFLSVILRHYWFTTDIGYIPIFSEIMTCSTATFMVWLIRQGWDNQFREIVFKE